MPESERGPSVPWTVAGPTPRAGVERLPATPEMSPPQALGESPGSLPEAEPGSVVDPPETAETPGLSGPPEQVDRVAPGGPGGPGDPERPAESSEPADEHSESTEAVESAEAAATEPSEPSEPSEALPAPPRPETPPIVAPPKPDRPPAALPVPSPVETPGGPESRADRPWGPPVPGRSPAAVLAALPGLPAVIAFAGRRPDTARIAQALARGVVSALLAVGAGLGGVAVLVLIVATCGATSGGFDHPQALLRVIGGIWLAAHHVGFEFVEISHRATGSVDPIVTVVPLRLAPLGLTVPLIWVLCRIGRRLADGLAGTAIVLASQVLVYTGLLYAVAVGVGTASVRPVFDTVAPAALGVLAAGVLGAFGPALVRVPAVRAGLASAAVLAAGGALLVLACLFAHAGQVRVALALTTRDPVGFAALAVLCAALVPNAIVWAVSYAAGTGFALGAATTIAPTGSTLGTLPTLPLLAALPGPATVPSTAWAPAVLPLLAGVAAGFFAARAEPPRAWLAVTSHAAGAGLGVGLLTLASARLASGTAGLANLADLGPNVWRTAAALTVEIALIAAPTALAATWWRGRESPKAVPAETETALGTTGRS
ncbi:cell division protein PerM [Embleya sp. NPDC001921]